MTMAVLAIVLPLAMLIVEMIAVTIIMKNIINNNNYIHNLKHWLYHKQVDILIFKNQALQILYHVVIAIANSNL